MRITKRGKWCHIDVTVNGVRIRETLKTTDRREAVGLANELVAAAMQGKSCRTGRAGRATFNAAMDAYLEERKLHSAEKTYDTDRERSRVLRRHFGETTLRRITVEAVVRYQAQRKEAGISGRTINLEVGLLRRVMKRNKQWARLADDVTFLSERPKPARVLTPGEKARLLQVASNKPEWETAYLAAVIALSTTMRGCELKGLRWKDVNLLNVIPSVTIPRSGTKTDAGARVLPLNPDALRAFGRLRTRAELVGATDSLHFVFPACEHGRIDPARPMKNWRTAWRTITRTAGLTGLRFHDLRHHAITELAERGVPEQTIMSVAGHVSKQMLDHYSHPRLEAKRNALEVLVMPLKKAN